MEEYTRTILERRLADLEFDIDNHQALISGLEASLKNEVEALERSLKRADDVRKDLGRS